ADGADAGKWSDGEENRMNGYKKASRQLRRLEGCAAGRSAISTASFPRLLLKYTINHVIHGGRKHPFGFHL
ncbi:hypothetical protein, partial [Salmonella enterica]|uniref:hypothetical protein n=1 Tax=Salmonella enterica TaxID=28901 RepID=UPI001CEFE62E